MAGAVSGYCKVAPGHPFHGPYHESEYGFPLIGDDALFERLALEINQAGLSWLTMLQKREGFRRAFAGFDPEKVARFGARDRRRLFKETFVFTGGEIVGAFLESTGYLRGAHKPSCPVYRKVAKKKPAWMK